MRVQSLKSEVQSPALVFAERATEITEFALRRGAECFRGWPVPTVFAYVFFHVATRTVFCVREGREISGVLFAWPMAESELRGLAAGGRSAFAWKRPPETADAIFVAEVIGHRQLLARLAAQVKARWPDWRSKKIFTFRSHKLVELKAGVIAKLLG